MQTCACKILLFIDKIPPVEDTAFSMLIILFHKLSLLLYIVGIRLNKNKNNIRNKVFFFVL